MANTTAPHIVRLDGWVSPAPIFSPSFKHTYTSHDRTPPDSSTISSRLATADIAITTRVPITADTLSKCPRLKLIAVFAIGTDMIDLAACKDHGVQVCNVPAASNEAVAEHAIALFFALRRNIIGAYNKLVNTEDWVKTGNLTPTFGGLPGTCRDEVMGIIGAGELGNRVATIARALGMNVLLSSRKTPSSSTNTTIPGRTPFTEVLQTSTVIVITCPLIPETINLISHPEFSLMRPDALLINVARGGIVNEEALVDALKQARLKGTATDVFVEEPAGEANSVLLRELKKSPGGDAELEGRVVVSPHVAWYARSSIEKLRRVVGENIEAWVGREEANVHFVGLGE